jgi:hydroxymethylpyrimidine/phosphomethylpyrimidine kinase
LKTAQKDGFKIAAVYDSHEPRQKEIKEISDYYITDFGSFCFKTKMKTTLTIAGSDPSGGAGIQADIKTITMNGVYAMSVITSLTAQNTLGVRAILDSTPEFLKEQLDAVFEDIFPDSIKIGMVSSSELIDVVADRLKFYNAKNIVVDPVMVATSGSTLIKTDAIKTLVKKLLPIATVVTPNIPEAEILSDIKISNKEDMIKAAEFIEKNYGCSVLLKGGHSINNANDLLCENGKVIWFDGKRIDNPNTHGTGCTLSSAIASNLAKGLSLTEAVKRAKDYISDVLLAGLDLGNGSGPVKHNFIINSGI